MNIYKSLLLASLMMLTHTGFADLVIVANSNSGIQRLSKSEVINIYLGRYRRLDNGATAVPIDLSSNEESKATFYRLLVDKNLAEINAYWSRLVFSGKTRPPKQIDNVDDALTFVANNPDALIYIERADINSEVMIVFEWPGS
jgi:ABC-type phosphate transport system substrate-binding protein